MNLDSKIFKYLLPIILIIFSISINFHYGNIGVHPIDTFGFFDSGYNVLMGKHPIKDFWIISGILVDYIQAFFFKVFGLKWSSYILHSSFFNLFISATFFLVLKNLKFNNFLSFLYAISVSILCYPVSGTPFTYQHSFILSLISILIFIGAINSRVIILWFLLPIFMVLSFLSQQTPSAYINLVLILVLLVYFFKDRDKKNFTFFIFGCLTTLIFLFLYFFLTEISLKNFINQYILFPISIGGDRILGQDASIDAFPATLKERFTFRGVVGHFKFINIFILTLILINLSKLYKRNATNIKFEDILTNTLLAFSSIGYIFHQLITANQTFIFALIPILAAFTHFQVNNYFTKKKYVQFLFLIFLTFVTIKYHDVYNVKRKFMDLQHADLSRAVDASLIDKKLSGLKWITPHYKDPLKEINLIKEALVIIKKDKRSKMVITHYQFFSFLLEEDLNIPNRWYFTGNNTFPMKGNKYFQAYKDHFNKIIKEKGIEVIYIVITVPPGEISIDPFLDYFDNTCLDSNDENKITTSHVLKICDS